MARLYADENFPLQVVEHLRRLGHEVLTVQDDGCAGQAIADPRRSVSRDRARTRAVDAQPSGFYPAASAKCPAWRDYRLYIRRRF